MVIGNGPDTTGSTGTLVVSSTSDSSTLYLDGNEIESTGWLYLNRNNDNLVVLPVETTR